MENTINNIFQFFVKDSGQSVVKSNEPQIGFKVTFVEKSRQVIVKVIGARQLPTDYGKSKPKGYVVKVVLFPSKEKFETKVVDDSWPTINEEFNFNLNVSEKACGDILKGSFVSFTIYAILEETNEEKPSTKAQGTLRRFLSFDENVSFLRRNAANRPLSSRSFRNSMKNRRTVGAVTYNLERKIFTQKLKDNAASTPDVWRSIKEITSGMQTQPREGKKGCVELTLQYAVSEDGANDVVEISVTKFRCSVQTMHDHEKVGGQLYIKISAFESDEVIQKKKSDKFEPTISLRLEANTATLRASVNNFMLNQVKIVIRLLAKNLLGKKSLLGIIEIDRNSQFWKDIVASPGVPITKMVNFE